MHKNKQMQHKNAAKSFNNLLVLIWSQRKQAKERNLDFPLPSDTSQLVLVNPEAPERIHNPSGKSWAFPGACYKWVVSRTLLKQCV